MRHAFSSHAVALTALSLAALAPCRPAVAAAAMTGAAHRWVRRPAACHAPWPWAHPSRTGPQLHLRLFGGWRRRHRERHAADHRHRAAGHRPGARCVDVRHGPRTHGSQRRQRPVATAHQPVERAEQRGREQHLRLRFRRTDRWLAQRLRRRARRDRRGGGPGCAALRADHAAHRHRQPVPRTRQQLGHDDGERQRRIAAAVGAGAAVPPHDAVAGQRLGLCRQRHRHPALPGQQRADVARRRRAHDARGHRTRRTAATERAPDEHRNASRPTPEAACAQGSRACPFAASRFSR